MAYRAELIDREHEFTEIKNMRLFVGSYNVNGKLPDESLKPWLRADDSKPIDLFVVGFQEVVQLSTSNFLLDTEENDQANAWIEAVHRAINFSISDKSRVYKLLHKYRMFGILLLIFVDEKLARKAVSELLVSSKATGFRGMVGNKGSVGISMKIYDTRICFVCSHFASDTDKVDMRNMNFRSALKSLNFRYDVNSENFDLNSHDIVFWFGDLNYRLDGLSLSDTLNKIQSKDFSKLLAFDQLTREKLTKRVFQGFTEGEIKFKPTYKFITKSDLYEKQVSVKLNAAAVSDQQENAGAFSSSSILKSDFNSSNHDNRQLMLNHSSSFPSSSRHVISPDDQAGNKQAKLPSWTDRVLWKCSSSSSSANVVRLKSYSCVSCLTVSDHKPIYSVFKLSVKEINQKKFRQVCESLLRDADRKLNDSIPCISLDMHALDFGDCFYYEKKTLSFEIKNVGPTMANVDIQFYDEQRLNTLDNKKAESSLLFDERTFKTERYKGQWVKLVPSHRENLKRDESLCVQVSLDLNLPALRRLQTSKSKLDDYLIVRCLNGNHKFITLHLNYKQTIMGISLKALTSLNEQSSFDSSVDLGNLFEKIEPNIIQTESDLDFSWQLKLKEILNEQDKLNQKLVGQSTFFGASEMFNQMKIDLGFKPTIINCYFKSMASLVSDMLEQDEHFLSNLSGEYEFLLNFMTRRAVENLKYFEENLRESESINVDSMSMMMNSNGFEIMDNNNGGGGGVNVEEQKNFILAHLSNKLYDELEKQSSKISLDVLIDLICDLLNAMPLPVIPSRYFTYCKLTLTDYNDALKLLSFLPRSHLRLFELIVKFVQTYYLADANLRSQLAKALFHVDAAVSVSASVEQMNNRRSSYVIDRDSHILIANKFFNLFIDHHKSFITSITS